MMREDPDLIFRVTASASKAVDFILSFSQHVEPRHNPPVENESSQICQPYRQSPAHSVPKVFDSDTVSSQKQAPAMQQEFIFHPKDTPGPSAELRRKFLSELYKTCHANSEAIKALQGITFDAIARFNHVTNEVHVALIGPASGERTELINLHNRSRQLRLVEISPRTVQTAHDVFDQISKVAADATLTLVEFQPGGHYILPPMDILLDDFHAFPDDLRRRMGNAIEHGTLETEKGFTVDCKNIHWIITAPDNDSLLRAFDLRLTIPHTHRLVRIMLGSQSEASTSTEGGPTNESRPVEKPQQDASQEEPPATLKFPGANPSLAPSQKQQPEENLRRWRESNQPRNWVEAHHGQWNHGDWLALLDTLRRSDFWPLDPDSIGEVLEAHRQTWASSVQRQADELAKKKEQQTPDSPKQPLFQEEGQEGSQAKQVAALPLDESDLRQQLTAYAAGGVSLLRSFAGCRGAV